MDHDRPDDEHRADNQLDDSDAEPDTSVSGPPTGRVRIVGAEPVGTVSEFGGAGAEENGAVDLPPADDPGATADAGGTGDADDADPAVPGLQHWTEAPTGEVPAVLARERPDGDDADPWAAVPAPTWREEHSDWEAHDESFEPAMLAMDDSNISDRHDTLDEERRPWAFDLSDEAREGDEGSDGGTAWGDEVDEASDDETLVVPVTRASAELGDGDDADGSRLAGDADDVFVTAGRSLPDRPGAAGGVILTDADADADADDAFDEVLEGDDPRVMGESGILPSPAPGRLQRIRRDRRRPRPVPPAPPVAAGGAALATSTPTVSSRPVPQAPPGPAPKPTRPAPRPPQRPPAGAPADTAGGRNLPVAVGMGVVLGAIALIAFKLGNLVTLVLATAVVFLASVEAYAAFRRGGYRPAVLLGWVATVSLMIATYQKGQVALPLVLILVVALTMLWYTAGVERGAEPLKGSGATLFVFCWVGVFGSYAALLLNPNLFPDRHGIAFLAGAIIVTVVYDAGAWAVGSWIGSRSLAPNISPGKTWEGAIGGAVAAVLAGVLIVHYIHPWTPGSAAVLGLVVAVFDPMGDLFESVVKRQLGLKDMGRLLPGHGGVLDRIDGLIFVVPATYYLVKAFNLG